MGKGMMKDADDFISRLLFGESMNPTNRGLLDTLGFTRNEYNELISPEGSRMRWRWGEKDTPVRGPLNNWDVNPWSYDQPYEGHEPRTTLHAPDNAQKLLDWMRNSEDPKLRQAYDYYMNYGRQGP